MKTCKRLLLSMIIVIAITLVSAMALSASEVSVLVDGEQINFEGQGPAVVDGRTLVPVRGVFEYLGFEVDWDPDTSTAYLTGAGYEVAITIGSADFTTNGEAYELDVPAQIIGGSTMLPIRAVLESVGLLVGWDEANARVLIMDTHRGFADFTPVPGAIERQMAMPAPGDLVAIMHTNMGEIHIRLFPDYAPLTVENFVTHARAGYYDGVIFHRVIQNFMNQGGDPTGTGMGGESIWGAPFGDEFSHNLRHVRGSLSMANAGPNTNGSQFFIVQRETQTETHLNRIAGYLADPSTISNRGWPAGDIWSAELLEWYLENGGTYHLDFNHTVFGQVFEGMDVVEAIEMVETGEADRPVNDVIIETIEIIYFGG